MKLEVGMYVRTRTLLNYDYVIITKIKHIEEKTTCLHIWLENSDLITEKYLVKASHNIIDLIEVGDIVTLTGEICKDEVYRVIGEGKDTIQLDCFQDGYMCVDASDIKQILTREQFESMSYKVGD